MKKIILVDVSSIFHRSYSILSKRMPKAVDSENIPCAGTYGFLTTFFKACREFGKYDEYLFALDVRGSTSVRKSIDSTYKETRTKREDKFYLDKKNLINNYLELFGFVPLGLNGYEADDIIASSCNYISRHEPPGNYRVDILSGDGDLEMCVKYSPNINFIKTQPKWQFLDSGKIMEKWGVDNPNDIAIVKAISGDSSDNIVGIPGYKRKKALKVYNNLDFLNENSEIIKKNLSLITLKDDLYAVPRPLSKSFSIDNLVGIFQKLNAPLLLKRAGAIYKYLV